MSTAERIRNVFKPMADLAVINSETTGAILLRQNAFFGELVESSVNQIRTLAEAPSVRDAVETQRGCLREVSSRASSVARDNFETLREGGKNAGSVLRGSFERGRQDVADAVEKGQSQVNETVDQARGTLAGAVSPEQQSAPTGF